MPQRQFAKVARMRISDVEIGDVVNKYPESESGWFVVAQINRLFDGKLQVSDFALDQAVSGEDFDMIGVQFVSMVTVEEQPELDPALLVIVDPTMQNSNRSTDTKDEPEEVDAAEDEALAVPAALGGGAS